MESCVRQDNRMLSRYQPLLYSCYPFPRLRLIRLISLWFSPGRGLVISSLLPYSLFFFFLFLLLWHCLRLLRHGAVFFFSFSLRVCLPDLLSEKKKFSLLCLSVYFYTYFFSSSLYLSTPMPLSLSVLFLSRFSSLLQYLSFFFFLSSPTSPSRPSLPIGRTWRVCASPSSHTRSTHQRI